MSPTTQAIVVAVIGLGTGGVASLIAPWATWGVEKRREKRTHQRELIKSWRVGLAQWEADVRPDMALGPAMQTMYATPWFGSLHAQLSAAEGEMLTGKVMIVHDGRRIAVAATVQRLIDQVERKWGLT